MKPSPKLPQPNILNELRTLRQKVQSKAQKVGWDNFIAEMNQNVGRMLGQTRRIGTEDLPRKLRPIRQLAADRRLARRRSSSYNPACLKPARAPCFLKPSPLSSEQISWLVSNNIDSERGGVNIELLRRVKEAWLWHSIRWRN